MTATSLECRDVSRPGRLAVGLPDNRAIFAAASHAQRAADFINGLQPAAPPANS
ncbi:MAG: hypothetical protein ACRD2I_00950 [Vicinamibacterales bacterium]